MHLVFDEKAKQQIIDRYIGQLSEVFDKLDHKFATMNINNLKQIDSSSASTEELIMLNQTNIHHSDSRYCDDDDYKHDYKHNYKHESTKKRPRNNKKMSDESFKMMQRVLHSIEEAKHYTGQHRANHLSQLQQKIRKNIKNRHIDNDIDNDRSGLYNNSEEKMSMDNNYYHSKSRNKIRNRHMSFHDVNSSLVSNIQIISNHNNHHQIQDIHKDIRRRLSFGGQSIQSVQTAHILDREDRDYEKKWKQSNQEIDDLHNELNCVYKTLDAVKRNRDKLADDRRKQDVEHQRRMKTLQKQLHEYRYQAMLYQKEQEELHANNYNNELMIEVSPAKSPNKSKRKYRHYQYKR